VIDPPCCLASLRLNLYLSFEPPTTIASLYSLIHLSLSSLHGLPLTTSAVEPSRPQRIVVEVELNADASGDPPRNAGLSRQPCAGSDSGGVEEEEYLSGQSEVRLGGWGKEKDEAEGRKGEVE
jgi:hypothetical protein